jgi:hypothetical protein
VLFDLRGKRRRLVQAVYILLALAFGIGFLGFGIGVGDGPGGFFDVFSGGGGDARTAFQQSIDDAQKQVNRNRQSAAAWLDLAEANFALARSNEGVGEDGLTDVGETAANNGIDAWDRYLRLARKRGKQPDSGGALVAASVYALIGDAEGAYKAQRIYTRKNPRAAQQLADLSLYAYEAGHDKVGDEAQRMALANTPADQRNTVKESLKELKKQGRQYHRQVKEEEKARRQQAKGQKPAERGTSFGPLPGQPGGGLAPTSSPAAP